MKTIKIIQLVISLAVIAALIVIMVLFISGKVNFSTFFKTEKQIVLLDQKESLQDISSVKFDLNSINVIITPSDDDQMSITYRGPESLKDKLDLTVRVDNGTLIIQQSKNFAIQFFNWNLTPKVLEITLPESYAKDLTIGNSSGNISVSGIYNLSDFSGKLTSGNFRIEDLTCNDFQIHNSSGNVTLGTISSKTLGISLVSGNLKADAITGDGKIRVSSGNLTAGTLIGKTTLDVISGNITVYSFEGSGSASCASGNINISVSKASGDLSAATTSGNVEIGMTADVAYQIDAHCTSGDIRSDFAMIYSSGNRSATGSYGTSPTYKLTLKTVSGNIALVEK